MAAGIVFRKNSLRFMLNVSSGLMDFMPVDILPGS
jgi:hypothetical protein